MLLIKPKKREYDDHGSGEFGAPRGGRKHVGVDFAADVGSECMAPASGIVTKLGYPYADDLSYQYVQITCGSCLKHRVFYVKPTVKIGDKVIIGQSVIGTVQDIAYRYKDGGTMINHVHYEIMKGRAYVNPEELF